MILILNIFQNLHSIKIQTHEGTLTNKLKGNIETENEPHDLLVVTGRFSRLDVSFYNGPF